MTTESPQEIARRWDRLTDQELAVTASGGYGTEKREAWQRDLRRMLDQPNPKPKGIFGK